VASKIARYKKPQQVVFVDTLPKTAEGKLIVTRSRKTTAGNTEDRKFLPVTFAFED
jgi:acyl-coenzyme A synthetase/AMP-(fatty) acid ligase